ncbi:TetR/AcrR family transcriptional regulator [Nonomuraea thailandensis]
MPKKVDHEERRRHVAEAVLRIAGRDGLGQAKLRDVAAEAGMSLGSVQHYFTSKDEMLRYVVKYLGETVTERIVAGMGSRPGVRCARSCCRWRPRCCRSTSAAAPSAGPVRRSPTWPSACPS